MSVGTARIVTPVLNAITGSVSLSAQELGFHTFAAPTISGEPLEGETLSVPPGYRSYQWYADGVAIAGATSNTFELTSEELGAMVSVSVGVGIGSVAVSAPVGSVVPAFFSEAVGIWRATSFQSSPREYVPNEATAVAVSTNLLQAPRRRFNSTDFYGKSNVTVTDRGITAHDGTSDASRIQGTGGTDWFLFTSPHPNLSAGTYTLKFKAQKHSLSGTQDIRCGLYGSESTVTIGASWGDVRVVITHPGGAQILALLRNLGTTAADIDICDVCLYAGNVNPTEPVPAGHLILGANATNSPATYASGSLDLSAGGWGLVQFQNDLALTRYTMVALVKKKTDTKTFNPIIGNYNSYGDFAALLDNAETVQSFFGTGDIASGLTKTWQLFSRGWKTHAHRVGATTNSVFVNGVRLIDNDFTPAAKTVRDVLIGAFSDPSNTTDLEVSAIALWNRELTDAEVKAAGAQLATEAAVNAITINDNDIYWLAEGDSITSDVNSYCLKYGVNATINVLGARRAVAGGLVSGLVSRAARRDAMLPTTFGNKRFVLTVLIGANDLTSAMTTAQFLSDFAAWCDTARAAGWIVVICTILPNTNVGFNAKRNVANTELRLWTTNGSTVPGKHADYICDFAADATMGPDAAASNVTYYPDGVHPSNAGHVILETVLRPVMNAL